MTAGAYISGAGHLILILWVVFGGVLFRTQAPDMLDTASVRLLSQDEFLSLTAGRPEPATEQVAPEMTAPGTEENTANTSPGDAPPDLAPRPEIVTPVDPDAAPEAPDAAVPEAEVDVATPKAPVAPTNDTTIALLPPALTPGRPREAPRVAPTPAPDAPPLVSEAPEFTRPTTPDVEAAPETQPVEDTDAAAPLETTTEIVTEADKDEPEGATVSGFPPRLRPPDAAPVAQADPTPSEAVSPSNGGQTATPTSVAEADPDLPVGPPLSYGEVDQLVSALEQCWRPGMLSTAAAGSTVVVGVSMNADGTPIVASIRLLDSRGPDEGSIGLAYETAVRAVRRCGVRGFPLPPEKYAHWAEIEITFSPDEGLLFQ